MRRTLALFALGLGIAIPGLAAPANSDLPAGAVQIEVPLGLPPVPIPADNPLTQPKIDLGRKLFMDRRLSLDNTMGCVMCHVPEQGFGSNEIGGAVGFQGRSHRRNAPTIYNSAYFRNLFHDGRELSLENQAWGPMLTANEMANASPGTVIRKIQSLPDYNGLFEAAFDGTGPTMQTISQAIASYERTVVSGNSRFDQWYYGGQENALSASEQRGFRLFTGRASCSACHTVGERSALFSDDGFHNTGIGYARSMGQKNRAATRQVEVAPGVFVDVKAAVIDSFSEPAMGDVGRYEITLDPADRWAYRTPTLRNIALTAPYMHDGSMRTLREVVDFYDAGGIANPDRDPILQPLQLSEQEKSDLIAFLRALSGDNIDALTADARSTPRNPPRSVPLE